MLVTQLAGANKLCPPCASLFFSTQHHLRPLPGAARDGLRSSSCASATATKPLCMYMAPSSFVVCLQFVFCLRAPNQQLLCVSVLLLQTLYRNAGSASSLCQQVRAACTGILERQEALASPEKQMGNVLLSILRRMAAEAKVREGGKQTQHPKRQRCPRQRSQQSGGSPQGERAREAHIGRAE